MYMEIGKSQEWDVYNFEFLIENQNYNCLTIYYILSSMSFGECNK